MLKFALIDENLKDQPIETAVLRRILVAARNNLVALSQAEGKSLPPIDRLALDMICKIEFRWKDELL